MTVIDAAPARRFHIPVLLLAWSATLLVSRNLANGHGLVWNPSDTAPFEAYTSFFSFCSFWEF
jgi:hypothetical protein